MTSPCYTTSSCQKEITYTLIYNRSSMGQATYVNKYCISRPVSDLSEWASTIGQRQMACTILCNAPRLLRSTRLSPCLIGVYRLSPCLIGVSRLSPCLIGVSRNPRCRLRASRTDVTKHLFRIHHICYDLFYAPSDKEGCLHYTVILLCALC